MWIVNRDGVLYLQSFFPYVDYKSRQSVIGNYLTETGDWRLRTEDYKNIYNKILNYT